MQFWVVASWHSNVRVFVRYNSCQCPWCSNETSDPRLSIYHCRILVSIREKVAIMADYYWFLVGTLRESRLPGCKFLFKTFVRGKVMLRLIFCLVILIWLRMFFSLNLNRYVCLSVSSFMYIFRNRFFRHCMTSLVRVHKHCLFWFRFIPQFLVQSNQ